MGKRGWSEQTNTHTSIHRANGDVVPVVARATTTAFRALELLATGANLTTVAQELGYDNTSAFIAMFQRCLGTTPARYLNITY